jgi:hypothetical protein
MTSPPEIFRLAPVAYTHAFGQIALTYNVLERLVAELFMALSPLQLEFAEKLFHKLNNRDRIDLLAGFVKKT